MSLKIIDSGILSLVQDLGRLDYLHLGVSTSGALDEYSYLWGNKLLANDKNAPAIEIFYGNFSFEVLENTNIVITGAKCDVTINERIYEPWQNFFLKAGDRVKIGSVKSGTRVYLAVKNGFQVKHDLGSSSVSLKEGFGGKKLESGDVLNYSPSNKLLHKRVREDLIPDYSKPLTLRVIPSYQYNEFPKEEQKKFFSSKYIITNDFNRMACKLKGEPINCNIDGIISEAIAFGSIQIPKDGQPIILLKERQTIGGYPKIGSVLPIDCFKLAQAGFNSQVQFEETSVENAQKKLKEFYQIF